MGEENHLDAVNALISRLTPKGLMIVRAFLEKELKADERRSDELKLFEPRINRAHVGSSFDDFLKEEGIFEEVDRAARARVEAIRQARLNDGSHDR